MLNNASRILRPGGLILLCEWGQQPLLLPSAIRQIPFVTRFHQAYTDSLHRVKGINELVTQIPNLLHQTNTFHEIHVQEHVMPIGDWSDDGWMKSLGERFRECIKIFLDSARPLLRQGGYSDDVVDSLVRGYHDEMTHAEGVVAIYYTIWATRL